MRKLFIAGLIIVTAVIGYFLGIRYFSANIKESGSIALNNPINAEQPKASASSTPQPSIGLPITLSIPKIEINGASVEQVGLDSQGRMDVPKKVQNAGWFNLGPRPGEEGNAVIAGHLDTQTGAPAIFYNLTRLEVGDNISITDDAGKKYDFRVTEKAVYRFDQVPLKTVFGSFPKSRLNLITCVGTWDISTNNYSDRVVVYSELVR